MLKTKDLYDLTHTLAASLLENTEYPWEALPKIKEFIIETGEKLPKDEYDEVSEHVWIAKDAVIYPNNYIAADELEGNRAFEGNYTAADKKRFDDYLEAQMAKVNLPDKDEAFLRERMLTMYANPLRNYLKVKGEVE